LTAGIWETTRGKIIRLTIIDNPALTLAGTVASEITGIVTIMPLTRSKTRIKALKCSADKKGKLI
jgi:hypothetical protein